MKIKRWTQNARNTYYDCEVPMHRAIDTVHLRGTGNAYYQWVNFDEWQFNKGRYMNEEWTLKAIKEGSITISNTEYLIEKHPSGSCESCCFIGSQCPSEAITICCSDGGNVLKVTSLVGK